MYLFSPIDRLLNSLTMYRVVMYVLALLAAVAITLSSFGVIHYSSISLILSLLTLNFVAYGANELFARVVKTPTNPESATITALILFFVLAPATTLMDFGLLALAAIVAMGSKYILAFRKQHIFNPVALTAVIFGILFGTATWWIGSPWMFVPTLIGALLIVRKTRRFSLFFAVLIPGVITAMLVGLQYNQTLPTSFWNYFASYPAIFFAAFMVTEPFTSPGARRARLLFGAGVGIFASLALPLGPLSSTPELALILGNLAAFGFGLRRRLVLTLTSREEIAKDTYAFHFDVTPQPTFKAGQYLEWTLPHTPDERGIRRYFTIASSPTEPGLSIGVKFIATGSSFKKRLLELPQGATMFGAMRGGDFVLPKNQGEKLAFIAGGIGVTPFRSMVKQLVDTNERRDIVLFYACKTGAEIAYHPLWYEAQQKIGMRTICVLSEEQAEGPGVARGFVTQELLSQQLPDWKERTFYLSGPDGMVQAYKKLLKSIGVSSLRIHTDYFPGF